MNGFKYEDKNTGEIMEGSPYCTLTEQKEMYLNSNDLNRVGCQIKMSGSVEDNYYIEDLGKAYIEYISGVVKGTEHGDLPFTIYPNW